MKAIQKNIDQLIRENVKKLKPYSSARDEFKDFDKDMVFLDANESPYGDKLNRYPDPLQRRLKERLAMIKGVQEKQLLLGNGSDEVLDLIFRAFCEPGVDNVITLPPTYGMYSVLAATNNIENREVLLNDALQPDTAAILQISDDHSKLLFICSPNNPTGNSAKKEVVENLLHNFEGIVVIDEAYIDFSPEESWASRLDEFPNLIVIQTLSKAYGLAAIRLGIGIASEEIIRVLNKIKPPYNVNLLTQEMALKGISETTTVKNHISQILSEKETLIKVLLKVKFVERIFPSDANFLLIKVDAADKRYEELLSSGIVVRNRSRQPLCEETLRITIGTPEENQKLINILNAL
ncbi:histidinol-phosphate transaminase [Robertkochia solimangrovi]|uniref:histidinol-phosphate transaminase n=1 Tax=Robertkochia solimangrovi TaxID=2213046 RepID=UPI00117F1D7D|nr:histidinol-phosphate transaminase [Robertkochia solimangrovi]TRZ45241.1 histidinol-phosphate transaminase [Robertkochia solimangrovi]